MLISSHNQISRVPDHYNPEIKSQDIVTTAIVIELDLTDRAASGQVEATIQHNEDNGLISINIQGNKFYATNVDPRIPTEFSLTGKELNLIFDDIYKFVAEWVENCTL